MNSNPSTTYRGYCLFVMANENLAQKKNKKHEAFLAMRKNQTIETAAAFLKADKDVEKAEKQLEQVRMMQKHNKRMS